MTNKAKVLVVDDTPEGRLMLLAMLEDDYDVIEADSGEDCLVKVSETSPDIVLLDVHMPGMDGYEVCVKLRSQKATEHLPIIFVSSLDSTEERLAGFEAGCDDYIIKPASYEVLIEKIGGSLERQNELKDVQKGADDAMSMAMEAMTVSSELGQIVQFVRNMADASVTEQVGDGILAIAKQFELNACVLLDLNNPKFIGCTEDSMEARVLEKVAQQPQRILSMGIRTIICNANMILLIKNMPLHDDGRCGRLKDHLAVLMDIADGQLNTILAKLKMATERKALLKKVIVVAKKQIDKTVGKLVKHQQDSQDLMQNMVGELEHMLFSLGLDEDQETKLMTLADSTGLKLEANKQSPDELTKVLNVIIEHLYELMKKE